MKKYLLLLPLLYIPAMLKAQDSVTAKISKIPFKHVDAMARFSEGDFKGYISKKLAYTPNIAQKITGHIILLTDITADGAISNVTILKSLSPVIDQEVVRVINASPRWKPAVLNGQNTDMEMVFNINIAINGNKPDVPASNPVKATTTAVYKPAMAVTKTTAISNTKPVTITTKAPGAAISVNKRITVPAKKAAPPVVKKTVPLLAAKIITKPAIKKPESPVAKKVVATFPKKVVPPPINKLQTGIAKKAAPIIAKTVVPPPVVKKAVALAIKKPEPVIAKKVVAPLVKKPDPPVVKKPAPVVAKAVPPPIVKPPAAKKPAPVVAKTVITPPAATKKPVATAVKKPVPAIAKQVAAQLVKKPQPVIAKTSALPPEKAKQVIATQAETPLKKPKRVVARGDLFHPTENSPFYMHGGLPGFFKYLGENIVYPPDSKKAKIEGIVVLTFVVEEDGSVNDIEILSSPADDLSQEATRVILASPKWRPAKQNGRQVPLTYEIPIKFTLAEKAPEKEAEKTVNQ